MSEQPAPVEPPDAARPSDSGDAPEQAPEHRRTHPITPLISGWKVIAGILAVLTVQNIAALVENFTLSRALIGLGVLAVVVLGTIAISFLSWRATTFALTGDGVAKHSGLISRTRQFAPRARIESVSVERPLLARLLGLAKVRIEVAGGSESHLDIAYVRSEEAERLRRGILQVAAGGGASARDGGTSTATVPGEDRATAEDATVREGCGTDGRSAPGRDAEAAPTRGDAEPAPTRRDTLREILHDGVTEGELIAEIPTERLVRSLLRDPEFLIGAAVTVLGVGAAIIAGAIADGFSPALLVGLLPALIALPRFVFGRVEAGWGFVSRLTDSGLRMRRGLANTRSDNIASGRIQRLDLRRPLLWRGPGWTAVQVTVAGIEDTEGGAESVLPVGTREEVARTLGHLAPPLGSEDDLALLERFLTRPAREIEGYHPPSPVQWIARRTEVTVTLPGAVLHRSGILAKRVQIIPRDRIQELRLADGPLNKRLGLLDLHVAVGGHTVTLGGLARPGACALQAVLARDAARRRRYTERASWPTPVLAGTGTPEQIR
ncbi:PH domain-containing protein [Brachybacterium squillarum]|uniref:PH domain-containing protein n=1 Tax=Brachybacterium squillarum TaxID=661979 RepID=UPI00026297C9|nr:PH domain-containing protein [Brachybacterium squillarum]